jgi:hypothetical protein
VRTAIDIQEKRGCRSDLAASSVVLSQVLAAKHDPDARAVAERALTLYEEMGSAPGLARARAALAAP